MYIIGNTAYIPQVTVKRKQFIINTSQSFQYDDDNKVIALSFKNVGDVNAFVNSMELNVNSPMKSYTAEKFVIDRSNWMVSFEVPTAGTNPKIEVEVVMQNKIEIIEVTIPTVSRR